MPYQNFTEYPLWKEASALTDSIFDFSRAIEDFPLRNRMTGAAVEIPFRLGEAAQSDSDETMKNLLWKVEDPVNELRSVLTEAKENGFAPGADYELMQERCRDLFQKVHTEASSPTHIVPVAPVSDERESEDPELAQEVPEEIAADDSASPSQTQAPEKKSSVLPPVSAPHSDEEERKKPMTSDDGDFDENALI